MVELPSGVELDLFRRRPLDRNERLVHWRRWLVEQPLGWDESGIPGSVAYQDEDLWSLREAEAILLYVGRFTAVKRLPLLLRAHSQALTWLGRPLPLVLVGGSPGEWEGEHPLTVARALGHGQVLPRRLAAPSRAPEALNAADLLVLPSVAEAFGLVLVEAMACGLPVIAADAHGPPSSSLRNRLARSGRRPGRARRDASGCRLRPAGADAARQPRPPAQSSQLRLAADRRPRRRHLRRARRPPRQAAGCTSRAAV